jgi:pyruvate,orthophosphate dikinase
MSASTSTATSEVRPWLIGPGAASDHDATPAQVGSKAHGLMRLSRLGLPVPPAFVLGVDVCRDVLSRGAASVRLADRVAAGIRHLEGVTGRALGSARRPLLVSVRSGAAVSMPGMLASLLDVGLNETSVRGLIRMTGNPRLAWDSYRRLVQSHAELVTGCARAPFVAAVARVVNERSLGSDRELDAEALEGLAQEFLEIAHAHALRAFPDDPMEQLLQAVEAVFRSWDAPRAVGYRRLSGLEDLAGTAVTVQAMVFGNAGLRSGAGVAFTRDPSTGADELYVDFVPNAQGEDVVAGRSRLHGALELAAILPEVHAELRQVKRRLETELRDMQDVELTVEEGRLWILQTRTGKRTPWAALRIACDMVAEGLIDEDTALRRLEPVDLRRLERLRVAGADAEAALARAMPASAGVATGAIALDAARAAAFAALGRPAILVREDMSTDDVAGIAAAEGILTAAGARTSHGAVVARELGKVCLVACRDLSVDLPARRCRIGGRTLLEGDVISLDGDAGRVHAGALAVTRERPDDLIARVEAWKAARRP